jgi:predicted transcriptional regulator
VVRFPWHSTLTGTVVDSSIALISLIEGRFLRINQEKAPEIRNDYLMLETAGTSTEPGEDTHSSMLTSLLKVAEQRLPGPKRAFGKAHTFLVFMMIAKERGIGRQALSESTGLGQGSIRTILKSLRREGYLLSDAYGCHLTESGKQLYAKVTRKLAGPIALGNSTLTVGTFQSAILIRSSEGVGIGIEQRDSAVREGADGATTFIVKHGKFTIPGGSIDCEKDYPGPAWLTLRKELKPSNGDAVIVSGAYNEATAKLGGLAAAITLL